MALIFDCTMFFNEFMMLELRLNILKDSVDRFVITEGNQTFSRQPKELMLRPWLEENFPDMMARIEVIEVTDFPSNPNPWIHESHQRNAVMRGLSSARPNDLIMLFDIDEIPDVAAVEANTPNDDIAAAQQQFFYFFFNLYKGQWHLGSTTLLRNLSVDPQTARGLKERLVIANAGWHFSYVMQPEKIAAKIAAFSHQEFKKEQFVDPERIRERVAQHMDLFDRPHKQTLKPMPLDKKFPSYLLDNRAYYENYIYDTVIQTGKPAQL